MFKNFFNHFKTLKSVVINILCGELDLSFIPLGISNLELLLNTRFRRVRKDEINIKGLDIFS
jgi:hypothetical protein